MPNPIIAPPSFDATRAAAYVLQRPHGAYTAQDVAAIAAQYWGICVGVGVDPGVAWAQGPCHAGAIPARQSRKHRSGNAANNAAAANHHPACNGARATNEHNTRTTY